MKSGLIITQETAGDVHVLKLAGFLDGRTCPDLEQAIDRLVSDGAHRLVLDLSGLSYIASAGVGVFISGQHRTGKGGGSLQLAAPSANVREIFAILGLESLFAIHTTVEQAVAAAKG